MIDLAENSITGASGDVTSWLDLIMKGGIVMIPIILLSFISIYIFIEKWMYLRRATAIDQGQVNSLLSNLRAGNREKAANQPQTDVTATGRIIGSGLEMSGRPMQEIESHIESVTNLEITKMEKDTGYLGIIAGIAPMLGFIGTISGVIKIFYNISLADNISIGIIAGGLYQKMICSGAGLIVGVLAYTGYHILQMKIDRYTISLQEILIKFIKVL